MRITDAHTFGGGILAPTEAAQPSASNAKSYLFKISTLGRILIVSGGLSRGAEINGERMPNPTL